MISRIFPFAAAAALSASGALAAPVSALSDLSYTHEFRIGGFPAGIFLGPLSPRAIEDSAAVDLDRDDTVLADTPFSRDGDTDAENPVPFVERRTVDERTADDAHSATAAYDVEILTVEEPGGLTRGVAQRVVDNTGLAALSLEDGADDAEASSDFTFSRSFAITRNVINTPPEPFVIAGSFDADVTASFDGADGFARTSLLYELDLDVNDVSDVLFSPSAPYLTNIEDDGPNATVTEFLDIGLDGFRLSVTASASGGDPAEARYSGGFGYLFSVTLDPGAIFVVTERFTQTNAALHRDDDIPPIPLPASLPLLAAALGGLPFLRRGRRS